MQQTHRLPFKPNIARPKRRLRWIIPLGVGLSALAGWEALVRLGDYPAYLLPGPGRVARRFVDVLLDGTLLRHTAVTLGQVLAGLLLAVIVASTLGYLLARFTSIERALSPYIVASQAVPVVAIAPLLVVWFGTGTLSKVLICALIVFFPVLINTVAGLRGIPTEWYDLLRIMRASRWQMLTRLEIPAALPTLLAGLKVGATLSVIGAVVGEFTGAEAGLGFMIQVADGQYDTAWMFVGVLALIALALSLYGLVSLVEHHALRWRRPS